MTAFLETVRKSDGERRYYVGGCRVTCGTFRTIANGRGFDTFQTIDAGTHWRHYKEGRL